MHRTEIDPKRLASLLGADWTVDHVLETGSTNADLLSGGQAAPALLVAERQSSGRGRFDRVWTSPHGAGLTFSVRLRPAAPAGSWGWLPLLAGVALADSVRELAGMPATLKWPNDLLAPDGRKLAGTLVQSAGSDVVVGIGLNVSTTADELPVETASSLSLAGAHDVDRTDLLAGIASALVRRTARFDAANGDAVGAGLAADYEAVCATLGQRVTVTFSDGPPLLGTATAIGADGSLVVRTQDDAIRAVHAGDVEHVRSTADDR